MRTTLNRWGRGHVQELAGAGRYGFEVLHAALEGRLGSEDGHGQGAGITAAVEAAYRDTVAAVLPNGFALDEAGAVRGPHPRVDINVVGAVHTVDITFVIAAVLLAPRGSC